MSSSLDMDHRDPKKVYDPETFRVAYDTIFAEPDPGVHSLNPIWKSSYSVFSCVRLWSYRIASICGVLSACCWGWSYGCTACYLIWCVTPGLKLLGMLCIPMKALITIYMDTCYRPIINVLSYLFWNIRVTSAKQDGPTQQV